MEKNRLDITTEDKDSIIFSREGEIQGTEEDDAVMVWGDDIVVNSGGGNDTVVSTGKNTLILDGEVVEVYGDKSSAAGTDIVLGSNVGSSVQGRNVNAWYTKSAEIKGTDAADILDIGLSRRAGIEGGQDDDRISLEMSRDNTVYLGYQSLWNKAAVFKRELEKLEELEDEIGGEIADLDREISRLEIVLIDPKMVEKREGLINERDELEDKLRDIAERRKELVLKINKEFKLGASKDIKSSAVDDLLKDFHDGNNYCSDFRGEKNKIVCGKGNDTVHIYDCKGDTIISGAGSCYIEQKNSARPGGNTFIVGTGNDTIVGLTEKDTVIIGGSWYASVSSEIYETKQISGDCTVWLQKPRLMTCSEEEGAFLLLGQGIDLGEGEKNDIEIQGKTYTISDNGTCDIRIEVRAPKEMKELEDFSGYQEVGGNLLAEIRSKGDWTDKTGIIDEGIAKIEMSVVEENDVNYKSISGRVELETATDKKKIISNRVGEETITLEDGSQMTVGRYEYIESERGDIYGYVMMPTEENLEEYGDNYRARKRYNILVDRRITGQGTVTITGKRPVLELVTDIGAISLLDWEKVPRVRGKFNYNYYKG